MILSAFSYPLFGPPSPLLGPSSPASSPSPQLSPLGCIPGQNGIPSSVTGELLCGTWGQTAPEALWHSLRDRWPLWAAGIAVVITLTVVWRVWRRRVWRKHARTARSLEIIPPVSASPAATVGLWRLLATLLPAPSRWSLRPARLVWEVRADAHGMRCGLWLSPGITATSVRRNLESAWPGVRVEETAAPRVPATETSTTVALRPTRPDWLPLVEDPPTATPRSWAKAQPDEDQLRAVYEGLAAAGRTGGGLLQVHLSRAPAYRLRVLHRAMTHPERARRLSGTLRMAVLLTDGLRKALLGVTSVFMPGSLSHSSRRRTTMTDPYLTELARQARLKYQAGPHFLVAVFATAGGPTKDAARSAAAAITGGFGLLSAHFGRRRLRRGARAAADRWVRQPQMSLAGVDEVAALAGLPIEPAVHGLPAAASRRRPGGRDVFRAGPVVELRTIRSRSERRRDGDSGEPTAWNAP
ncbi:hypothetical protein Ade02nite_23260 [Paractinoplanes deccanensis]|uniref:Type VI secretion protein n=1 Tax=Paractinoplanes deccanensis TaxID=113561 RepID=A0ABQ3Y131_9ACTN|nr:hypothetical protein [Actinoplanes deccanensis]GID73685.1 hypothetical protein Ade02nite_23260 [Actinoplanes deccanensis]